MASPLSIEINGIDPVTIAAVELIIQTLPELRLRLVDSRRLSAELVALLPEERLFARRSQALRSESAILQFVLPYRFGNYRFRGFP